MLTFAIMKKAEDINMYKGLASYFLPEGVLDYFDVVDFAEDPAPDGNPYGKTLHLYLDERADRTPEMADFTPNGFTEERCILDFPIRARRTVLHVRRRRWLTPDGHNFIVPLESIARDKTQYSKELQKTSLSARFGLAIHLKDV